jgi:two-component system sensor histidine kinase SenX3
VNIERPFPVRVPPQAGILLTIAPVDVLFALLVGVAVGAAAVTAIVVGGFAHRGRRRARAAAPTRVVAPMPLSEDLARRSLETLRAALVVVDPSDEVVLANPAAHRMGVVRDRRISHGTLRTLVRQARSGLDTGETVRDTELDLPRGRMLDPLAVRVRVAALGLGGHVVLQVEDVTEVHRVAKVRRDFVANVSHELKTPVGALQLLAEAVSDATDDPEAVRRFAARMQHESDRLGRLVHEIIVLSRLQGAEPLPEPVAVSVDRVVTEVLDRSRATADARQITVVSGGERGLEVSGSESQLITALGNLVDNAIAYSPEHTRVAIGIRQRDALVEVSVSDQGMGIAEADLDRIFERFYRADPARSRATGGTGLGLAIVKHIATNHGGSVDVWSVEGSGSTFTLRLPVRSRTETGESTVEVLGVPDGASVGPPSQRGNA